MPFPKLPGEVEIDEIMADPQPGDLFQEMYAFWCYVVARNGDQVTIMHASPPCTFPEDGTVETMSVPELRAKFAYESMPGYFVAGAGRGHDVAGWLEAKTHAT